MVVDIAHGGQHFRLIALYGKVGKAFAMRHGNRQAATRHAGKEDTGRIQHFDHAQAGFEAGALVVRETRPVFGSGNDPGQFGKHLAAIAHSQRKGVWTGKESGKGIAQLWVERNGARPAHASTQCVTIAETTASNHALHIFEAYAASLQIGHMHVKCLKPRTVKRIGHFDMAVDALFTQNGHTRAGRKNGGCFGGEGEVYVHARVAGHATGGMLAVGAGRVVTQLTDFPADAVPQLVQLVQAGGKNLLRIAPDGQLPLAHVER